MEQYQFIDREGTFVLKNPELASYAYFPIANEAGMMSSVTPSLGGDAKTGQNTFLLEPVSSENLHNNKSSRNFWLRLEDTENTGNRCNIWSVAGVSAWQQAQKFTNQKEKTSLEAGLLYQKTDRICEELGLKSEITIFVPVVDAQIELMKITIENIDKKAHTFTPIAAIPLYARSADNIRDHRNVTSMLHRILVLEEGICVVPTLTFDERGHRRNHMSYGVFGSGCGKRPVGFYPVVEEFIGEGGSFENPYAVVSHEVPMHPAKERIDGYEAMGGIVFEQMVLLPGERASYVVALGCMEHAETETDAERMAHALSKMVSPYLADKCFEQLFTDSKAYWKKKNNISYCSGDKRFDAWMYWVDFQPMLRRIYGCSFLPHHDYGKGGRGWRDLWQDCLALLLMNPEGVRDMLYNNFGGVRIDGTNATIIGTKQGEFIADRNGIARVWMDHGMWPYLTVELYLKQSGDLAFLLEKNHYFKDNLICRADERDTEWEESQGNVQRTADGEIYKGTILEHILLQHLTAFYDVGEHNHIRLRGADWNDALDMAGERGESVAFTTIYGGNLSAIAAVLRTLKEITGVTEVELAEEMTPLLRTGADLYDNVEAKQELLAGYYSLCRHVLSGKKALIQVDALVVNLEEKAEWIKNHVRRTEWVDDGAGGHWFNSYYDNSGRRVEGHGEHGVRMMLTGQVFAIMSGTASDEQIEEIVKAADTYLYDASIGGYQLNTDFGEIKTDMGRMFGFAYGQKENGAVFCHMAVMYANALYQRGFVREGYRVIESLYSHICDAAKSGIYPGIPEYIDARGRGVYHYLTGAASWLMMTVLNEMFGVKGRWGDLLLAPKLLKKQFDAQRKASVWHTFNGRRLHITYDNPDDKEYGEYAIGEIIWNGVKIEQTDGLVSKEILGGCKAEETQHIVVKLA